MNKRITTKAVGTVESKSEMGGVGKGGAGYVKGAWNRVQEAVLEGHYRESVATSDVQCLLIQWETADIKM